MEERIKVLAEFLGIEESEISKGYRDNMFETSDGEEYLVVTDEEADDEFYNYESELIDELGLDAFSDWAKDYIIENCVDTEWFENFYYEDYESYANDIETEPASSDEYENRLEEEMSEAGVDTKEDFVEYAGVVTPDCEEIIFEQQSYNPKKIRNRKRGAKGQKAQIKK